jgi:hypothetical protein
MNGRAIVYNTLCLNWMQTFIELVSNVFSYVWSQMFWQAMHLLDASPLESVQMWNICIWSIPYIVSGRGGVKSYVSFKDDKYFIIIFKFF